MECQNQEREAPVMNHLLDKHIHEFDDHVTVYALLWQARGTAMVAIKKSYHAKPVWMHGVAAAKSCRAAASN